MPNSVEEPIHDMRLCGGEKREKYQQRRRRKEYLHNKLCKQ
jgi:hypothetical protein